jgi:filamentous hemagglutinin
VKNERIYEKFVEVMKKNQTIEELTKNNKKLEEVIIEIKLKAQEDLTKAKSYDEIRKLDGFKEMEKRVEKYQKENEELKAGSQPEVQKLKETVKRLEGAVAKEKLETEKARSSEEVEKLDRVKELKQRLDKSQKEKEEQEKRITELKSSEYIENLERVRKLVGENNELRNQNQTLRDQGRMSKKKGENFEQYVLEELSRIFDNKDKISKITQKGEKADFLQEILTENDEQVAGRIIYEVKNEKK